MSRRAAASGGFDEDQPLQPAGTQQRGVDEIRAVGGAQDDDVAQRIDAVELGQQRGHHPVGDARVEALPAPRRQRVDLVEEDQRGRRVPGAPKQFAHSLFRTAHPLVHQLGALDRVHGQLPGAGQRAHDEGLAAAGRAVQQHAARRVDAEPGEGVGMLQRPQHGLGQRLAGLGHVADVVEGDVADADFFTGRAGQRPDDAQRADQVLLAELGGPAVGTGPRRRAQRRLAHQRGQVGDDETRCA